GLNASSLLGGADRGPYSGANPAACMYLRIVLRSQPVNLLMAWMLIPCRCSSFSSCTSLPLNKSRNLLREEWAPVYHVKGWGKFNRHYGDFCTGADILNTVVSYLYKNHSRAGANLPPATRSWHNVSPLDATLPNPSRMCCKQRTCTIFNSFRCNTYKNIWGGGCPHSCPHF